jgi:hypothetical protein
MLRNLEPDVRHPLLIALAQVVLGLLAAYFLTEQWQRWRQRRDFQFRTLAKFSELSYDLFNRLSELLVGHGRIPSEEYNRKRLEYVARWTVFVSMRGEVMACFGHGFLCSDDYQNLYRALDKLRSYVRAAEPVPLARFEPEQEKFLAHREAIVADMVRAMGLISRRHHRAEKLKTQDRLQKANAAASAAAEAGDSPKEAD